MRASILDAIGGRGDRIVVSVSGGKDSAATCLMLMEHGFGPDDYDRVFADTGWELPAVYEYLRGPLTDKVGPITEVRWHDSEPLPEHEEQLAKRYEQRLGLDYSAMVRVVLKKASLPSRLGRFCTELLKIRPVSEHLKAMDAEPVNAVGI